MTLSKKNDSSRTQSVMVVHENEIFNRTICRFLSNNGFEAVSSFEFEDAKQQLMSKSFDLILIDSLSQKFDALKLNAIAKASDLNSKSRIYVLGDIRDPNGKSISSVLKTKQNQEEPFDLNRLLGALKSEIVSPEIAYDARLINAFVLAAEEVYEFYFHEKPERSNLEIREQGVPEKGYATGVIELAGEGLQGSMGVGMTAPAVKVLSEMIFKDIALVFDNAFIGDITGEMCNQVLGRAKIHCARLGVNVNIGLPNIYVGKNHIVQHTIPSAVVSIVMGRGSRSFELQFVFSHKAVEIHEASGRETPVGKITLLDDSIS